MQSIIDMWRDRKPIAVIAETHNVKRREVIEALGNEYSKNEAHYRANEYRDAKRLGAFADWFTNSFDPDELQQAINDGQLQAYWIKIAEPEKLTVPAVRDYVTAQLGELPARTTSKSKYDPDNYHLGKKSRYFGREQELIDMWQKDGLSVDGIYSKTGVSKLSLKKLLTPLGYSRQSIARKPIKTKAKTVVSQPTFTDEQILALSQINGSQARTAWLRAVCHNQKLDYRRLLSQLQQANESLQSDVYKKRLHNKAKDEQIVSLIKTTTKTTHEIAVELDVSFHKVSRLANDLGVNMAERTMLTYAERGVKISRSLKVSDRAKESRDKRRHRDIHFDVDFMSKVPDWAWALIEKQPQTLMADKLFNLFKNKDSLIELLQTANSVLGRKINISEIKDYIPEQKGILDWYRIISDFNKNDADISGLTSSYSQYESRVASLLNKLGLPYKTRDRSLGFELDFYLPDLNIAIETSPLATHNSNRFAHYGLTSFEPKRSSYHYNKYKTAQEHGIMLITLFEKQLASDVWQDKTVPMLTRILLGHAERTIYARQTTIKAMTSPTDKKTVDSFLERYHMDGKTPALIRYAMFCNNEIVGVATFTTPTSSAYKKQSYLELKRLAFASDVQVRYGLSKFIKRVSRDYPMHKGVMTYSNNNMGRGAGYAKSGFDFVNETGAQLTFVNPKNPQDTYSWSVATKWGAKSGVIAKLLGSQDIDNARAREIVETILPHRTDDKTGYVAQYDSGNKLWLKTF